MAAANGIAILMILGISVEQVIAMQRQLPESVERSASLSAGRRPAASPRLGRLSGTRRAARSLSDLDLVRRTLRMRRPRRRHVARRRDRPRPGRYEHVRMTARCTPAWLVPGLTTILVDLAGVSSAHPFASPAMLQLLLGGTSHVAQSEADRALPLVAPAIERVYRNSQHLGQISDRHQSLAHIERPGCYPDRTPTGKQRRADKPKITYPRSPPVLLGARKTEVKFSTKPKRVEVRNVISGGSLATEGVET